MDFSRNEAETIIGAAATADARDKERLTQAEVEAAAADVGIPREKIREAVDAECAERAASAERSAGIRRRVRTVAKAAAGLLVLWTMCVFFAGVSLTSQQSIAASNREAVELAFQNRAMTTTALAEATTPGERSAAVYRLERRVYIAKHDYDVVASAYNSNASSLFGRGAVFFTRLPAKLPSATEIWSRR